MTKVQLYVYDLSNGLAKAMSRALTGTQLDGIWHTSVVAWEREVFYGQGISECPPGGSHHGRPVEMVDCGETEIDMETFDEYIDSLRDHYTADAYHLLTFNCNSFTQDVIGFLTGGSIPAHISDLPTEFLATPFGASLRPQIDAMFRRGPVGAASGSNGIAQGGSRKALETGPQQNGGPDLASTLLQAVAQQATAANGHSNGNASAGPSTASSDPNSSPQGISATEATATSLLLSTNLPSFHSHLSTHPCLIALFTNPATCPPCRVIDPVFTNLAETIGRGKRGKVGFVKVDMGAGDGGKVAGVYGVKVMPTFLFFRDGKMVHEMKGATTKELENKISSFIDECFPPHPHQRLFLPAVNSIPLHPILPANKANFPGLMTKLEGFLSPSSEKSEVKKAVETLKGEVVPRLLGSAGEGIDVAQVAGIMDRWRVTNEVLLNTLEPEKAFPVVDLLVYGLSNSKISAWTTLATQTQANAQPGKDVISTTLSPAANLCDRPDQSGTKPTLLTTLRLLQMCCKDLPLARTIFGVGSTIAPTARKIFLHCQLHEDVAVRNAAAGLAINLAGIRHRTRKERGEGNGQVTLGRDEKEREEVDEDWELEELSAVVEAIENTVDEDILYRLTAALALQIYLSPIYEDHRPFLEVMEVKQKLQKKLIQKIAGKALVTRGEVRKLLVEVGEKLC